MSGGPHPLESHQPAHGRAAWLIAAAAAIAAAVAGLVWGTHVAGGPDSYCYLSQAELFASGHVMHIEPLAARAPWEHGADAFVPVGHVPAFDRADGSVPMCSPGYPIAMAIVRHAGGRIAMFGVVPILGAVAVWLTFILGRRISGPASGAVAAVLMAASPPFLYQVVQPMSDVPAAALWAAALVAVTNPRFPASLVSQLERLPGFRNVVVHEYVALDLERVVDALNQLGPIRDFAEIVRQIEQDDGAS